jgi:hypothetical protein
LNLKPGDVVTIDEQDVYVTESMIAEGSLACQVCNEVSFQALLMGGTLFWLCEHGHENKVTLYE